MKQRKLRRVGKQARRIRKQAKGFVKLLEDLTNEAEVINNADTNVRQASGISPIVEEALEVLEDESLEFTGEMDIIRQPLANLTRLAALYPLLHSSIESLAKVLLTEDIPD